jgi:sugar/nucleoside kinase (ribokinase family)
MNVLIVGELNVDLVMHNYDTFPALGREVLVENATLTLGSASAICAAGFARLGDRVTYLSKAGEDDWGDLCVDTLNDLGVDTSLVIRDAAVQTGITVSITSAKDRALVTHLGSIAAFQSSDIPANALAGFNHLHVSSFFLQQGLRPDVKALLGRAHALGLTTSLDPGFDPEEKWGPDLIDTLNEVDVFLPNEVELAGMTRLEDPEQSVRALINGRTLIMAKLGSRGCFTIAPDHQVLSVPAFQVNAVDTTGAGDSFNAGFLHAWLRKMPLLDAMRFGCACGALSTTGHGGTGSQATEAQANEFLQTHAAGAKP